MRAMDCSLKKMNELVLFSRRQQIAAVMVVSALLIALAQATVVSAGWSTPVNLVVEPPSIDNKLPQIALDSSGNPHITWYGKETMLNSSMRIYYATKTGSGWTTTANISGASSPLYNRDPQIAVDSGGNPHVVWTGYDGSDYRVYYAKHTGSGWTTATNISGGGVPTSNMEAQIALDSSGYPHITWFGNNGNNRVFYTEESAAGWTVPTDVLDDNRYPYTSATDCGYPLLSLDSFGDPNIVYNATTYCDCLYSSYSADLEANWASGVIEVEGDPAITLGQLGVDSFNRPHVVMYNMGFEQVGYAVSGDRVNWSTPKYFTVPGATSYGVPRMALDSSNFPHITFPTTVDASSRIYYIAITATGWSEPIDISPAEIGGHTSAQIVLDSDDLPHVTWIGGIHLDKIYYSTFTHPPAPSELRVPQAGTNNSVRLQWVAGNTSLTHYVEWVETMGDSWTRVYTNPASANPTSEYIHLLGPYFYNYFRVTYDLP